MLFARLAQIAPEKADHEELGQIHPVAKLENLIVLFGETADESIIPTFAETLSFVLTESEALPESERAFVSSRLLWFQTMLDQMRGDVESMQGRELIPLRDDAVDLQVFFSLWGLANNLTALKVAGNNERARVIAQQMLDTFDKYFGQREDIPAYFRFPLSVAYVQLNDEEGINGIRASLIDQPDEFLFSQIAGPFYALSVVDTDAAIERLLSRKAYHPSWYGTDWIATAQISNRHMLVHPRMQEFYVKEGKWLDYLAVRVPEYAEYKK